MTKVRKTYLVEFDEGDFHFRNPRPRGVWRVILSLLCFAVGVFALCVITYGAFSLFFKTDTERSISREIKMYEKLYSGLEQRADLLKDAIASLQYKDREIYEQVFKTGAPDAEGGLELKFGADTIPDASLVSYTRDKADILLLEARNVEEAFFSIATAVTDSSFVLPPMNLPIKNMSYSQVGASTGRKIDPFYKAYVFHEGLDLVATRGTQVLSSADGVVEDISTSRKFGKTVTLTHKGGYTTLYSHLETVSVRKGQSVRCGEAIGTVGVTGKSIAPHLHYEVRLDGQYMNPVNYFFGSLSPSGYADVLFVSEKTKQSMD